MITPKLYRNQEGKTEVGNEVPEEKEEKVAGVEVVPVSAAINPEEQPAEDTEPKAGENQEEGKEEKQEEIEPKETTEEKPEEPAEEPKDEPVEKPPKEEQVEGESEQVEDKNEVAYNVDNEPAQEPANNEEQVEDEVEVQNLAKEPGQNESEGEAKAESMVNNTEQENEPQEPVTDNQDLDVKGEPEGGDSEIQPEVQVEPKEVEVENKEENKDQSEREIPNEENKDDQTISQAEEKKDIGENSQGLVQEVINTTTGPLSDIQALIDEIKRKYDETGELFEDPEFLPDDNSLYKDPTNPPDYAKDAPFVEWKRPQEIASKPQFVVDDMTPGDIIQGVVGDCWLLGSFCCLATRVELLNNLIVYNGMEYGVVVLQFFKNGEWKPVVVDTRLPYDSKAKKLLYARCERNDEFWICFLEKAYAKLYKCYQELDGGKMQEGLVDLTGGITEKINVKDVVGEGPIQPARTLELWKAMKQSFQLGYLMGCSLNDKNAKVSMSPEGIVVNHAYGVISIREIQGLKLIRLRNPWGKGEWRGSFSDDDDNWDNYKGLREALGHELKDDGVFWMEFKDWCMNFNKVYLAKIFPSTWQQYSVPCAWKGKTNGGRILLLYL